MGLKDKAKEILGLMRAKIFGVTAGQSVYIGKHCSLKGKRHINLEDFVSIRSMTTLGNYPEPFCIIEEKYNRREN